MNKKPNIVRDKSFAFALQIIKVVQYLQDEKREYILSKQLMRSGTAIGALIREAEQAQSRPDFVHKMNIALKEANETDYWIDLLFQSQLMPQDRYDALHPDIQELLRLLISIVKSSKP